MIFLQHSERYEDNACPLAITLGDMMAANHAAGTTRRSSRTVAVVRSLRTELRQLAREAGIEEFYRKPAAASRWPRLRRLPRGQAMLYVRTV